MNTASPDRRAAAQKRWQELGWPTTHSEAWRNFSTKPLQELPLEGGITAGAALPEALVASWPSPRLVLVDGRFSPAHSRLPDVPGLEHVAGPGIADLAHLERVAPPAGAMESLNTALLGEGVALHVRPGVAAGVLHVIHVVTGQGTAHVRTIVVAERDASLTLAVMHLGLGDGAYFVNAVTEIDLAEGASLQLAKCVREGVAGAHLDALHARVGERARFDSYTLSLSGARVRNGVTVTLAGPHAAASVDGLYLGQGRAKLDHVTDIRHAAPDTRSSETWSGVLDDRAEGGFQGVIRIDEGAVRSATRQLTRTLLLSNDAEAHAKPELHIDCDDVQASHGATIGQLDPIEQFYLESRGIPPGDARRMLIRAFVDKQLSLAPAAVRSLLAAAVAGVLGERAELSDDV